MTGGPVLMTMGVEPLKNACSDHEGVASTTSMSRGTFDNVNAPFCPDVAVEEHG